MDLMLVIAKVSCLRFRFWLFMLIWELAAANFNELMAKNSSQEVCSIVKNHSSACAKVHDLYPLGDTMNIPSWAALILAACLVCGEAKMDQYQTINDIIHDTLNNKKPNQEDWGLAKEKLDKVAGVEKEKVDVDGDDDENMFSLKVGRTINVFPRYGSLTLTMKVIPSRFAENWLFREKTSEIFQKNSYWAKRGAKLKDGFDDHFLIDFCDSAKDLYAAYFDHFEIEGIHESHKAFTSFLSPKSRANALGIFPNYLTNDDYSYVLVRLFKRAERALLDGDLQLDPKFVNASKRIRVGSTESAHQFMDQYGSHVIVEYELGDVIYQVFVFGQRTYHELKTTFALSYEESKGNLTAYKSPDEQLNIRDYFTPYFAVHVGQVRMASGNEEFDDIRSKLKKRYFMFRFYQSIFQILSNKEISEELVKINGQIITGMRLKKVTKALTPTPERYWLSIILDNTLSLYYVSM